MEYDSENNVFCFVDSNDDSHSIGAIFEVCGRCHGTGKHVNSNVDGHGISPEEFAEDPEFRENYFNGIYDVTCEECNGLRVVSVPDLSGLSPELLKEIEEAEIEDARYESMCRMERMMGC